MKKINEIFYSIQGEGCQTGVPSVFVRFSGCNIRCDFCDTDHESFHLMGDDEIIEEIKKYPARNVVLTGGEPSLFIDENFIKKIKSETGNKISIETNGTHPLPEGIDWITVSPKEGMRVKGNPALHIVTADEIKVVDVGQPLEHYFKLSCVGPETQFLLQPCYDPDPFLRKLHIRRTIRRVKADPRWRLSLQTHRLCGIQ